MAKDVAGAVVGTGLVAGYGLAVVTYEFVVLPCLVMGGLMVGIAALVGVGNCIFFIQDHHATAQRKVDAAAKIDAQPADAATASVANGK